MAPVKPQKRDLRGHKGGKTGVLVINALTKLKHKTGWTANTITKFIQSENGESAVDGKQVSRALRRGVNLGLLKMHDRKFRLNPSTESSLGEPTDKGRRRKRKKSRSKSRKRKGGRRRRRR